MTKLNEPVYSIRNIIGHAIAEIAFVDFPNIWENFLEGIVSMENYDQEDLTALNGCL